MDGNLREKAVMAVVGVVVLYAAAVGIWFFSAKDAWKKAARSYEKAKDTYQREVKLIGEKDKWVEAYETEKKSMKTFAVGKATDTTWLRKLGAMAETNLVVISSSQAGKEIVADDVLELPIEVRGFEGSLEGLVKLMYQLENSDEGMFDITQINFKPSSKKGYLRGGFTVNCAYMRTED